MRADRMRTLCDPAARGASADDRPRLHAVPDLPSDHADLEPLVAEAERQVAQTLARGRLPRRHEATTRLLGRVLRARLRLRDQSADLDPTVAPPLQTATESLRATLELWAERRARGLEWIIILLIALDIVVGLL